MEKGNKKTTLVLSYNDIEGYDSRMYESDRNKVMIYSQDKRYYTKSSEKLSEILHNLYGEIELEKIDNTIVYAGANALEGALNAASRLSKNSDLTIVACNCSSDEKRDFAKLYDAEIIWSECGGRRTLSRVITEILEE